MPATSVASRFFDLNVNKCGLTLDLTTPAGKEIFWKLAAGAHMIVESGKPGAMARLALSYDQLKARTDGVILVSISNFGQTGPYRDRAASRVSPICDGARDVRMRLGGSRADGSGAEAKPVLRRRDGCSSSGRCGYPSEAPWVG